MNTKKPKVLFIGPDPNSKVKSIGGTVAFFTLLFNTEIINKFHFIFVDSTINIHSPYLVNLLSRVNRVIRLFFTPLLFSYDIIIYIQGNTRKLGYYLFLLTSFINLLKRKPIILALRGSVKGGKLTKIESKQFQKASYIWFQSHCVANNISKKYKIPKNKIIIIPNAIDISKYPSHWTPPPRNTPFSILFLGWLIPEKGVHELLTAFHDLSKTHPDIRLTYIGDGTEKTKLTATIKELKLEKKVSLKGWVQSKKTNYIKTAHCVVLPTYKEGFSNAILEGMAVGRAIITTPVGANPDLIKHNKNGFLVPVKDTTELKNSLDELLLSPSTTENMGKLNYDIIQKTYKINDIANSFAKYLNDILEKEVITK